MLDEVWNGLPAVHVAEILGSWKGTCLDTGHRGLRALQNINWYGHTFHSPHNAQPLVRRDPDGTLYSDEDLMFGEASLWMAMFRGQLTATMIYDGEPVLTHFKKVDDRTLLAIMNGKPVALDNGRHLYYVLDRAPRQGNDAGYATPAGN
ncbi:DUF4334 domain-containing protein [Lentzea sp. NPDC051838]|uniref:DUF4334 domain-containing protein n=1 Tax=Lentzea sp. NPDC051838 TaxID=3154849 RepID=UPI0034307377